VAGDPQPALPTDEARAAAARAEVERALAPVLDRLVAELRARGGRLWAYSRSGLEAGHVASGEQVGAGETTRLALAGLLVGRVELFGAAGALQGGALARVAVEVASFVALAACQAEREAWAFIAHEVRNPLAGILSFSDLLPEEAGEVSPKYIHLMGLIHEDGQRLKRLVEGVLARARVPAPTPGVRLDLAPFLRGLAAELRPWAEQAGAALAVEPAGVALADPPLLAVVLANLVAEAQSGARGPVRVRARAGPAAPRRWGGEAGEVLIEVEAPGGAPRSSLFDAEDARAVGLALALELVPALGATLRAEERAGATAYVLTLPAGPG
jgi:signal transduction histidine kinase